jgi:polysaccharide export outer membrane protein
MPQARTGLDASFCLDYRLAPVPRPCKRSEFQPNRDNLFAIAKRIATTFACAACLSALACSSPGAFMWYTEVPRSEWGAPGGEYVISVGDTITVSVYDQANLTTKGKIRSDGRIAVPFAGEVSMAGRRPSEVARELEGKLKEFIVSPRVTINIDESKPMAVSFVGEISHSGTLQLEPSTSLLQAIAQAGGPGPYANKSRIFVLRQFPQFRRIRFTYPQLIRNEGGAATFPLRNGDVIVVE